ncbi:acyl-CoA dehydrogenase NM domain-like protein [Polyporus arcularius HHB13444]|uniref:Acyl-CoA dehydrogenase NM domain-like protein n=1 Tax=Polyporus arcularius HHB13444 TaxID=1314778 RepID=A0A5C3PUX4_9APHY|nr:acyl-CoA dehydrogenase NM domain-like protein [Polyporus arcularius HHB13444]
MSIDPLFHEPVELLSTDARVALSYKRARLLMHEYAFTVKDVLEASDKFWALQSDPRLPLDMACYTILAAHVGLALGTLAKFAETRGDVAALVGRMLTLDTVGLFLLSERGHGLDSFNIETTATLTPEGFILNTPREEASKWMPATTPSFGIPKVAIVVARLIVSGEDRGCRCFIVPICDTVQMYKGVRSTRLPTRSGTAPLDFSITTFDHVLLPVTALLGDSVEAPKNPLQAWWGEVWRIPIGTGAVAGPVVQALKHAAYIGTSYSLHRHVVGKTPTPVPLMSFWTQRWAMVQAVAVSRVLDVWYPTVVKQSVDKAVGPSMRHAYSVIAKAGVARLFQTCMREVIERCGAQGTFEHNFMARMETDAHGVIIAEGDVLSLCIRLYNELLLGRYSIPPPAHKDTLLWRHAEGLLRTAREYLATCDDHRSEKANAFVLPLAEAGVSAIGHALAYSAAIDAAVPKPLLDVYECAVMRLDAVWYSESAGLSSLEQRMREDKASAAVLPRLDEYLRDLKIARYVRAPIVSDAAWKAYLKLLPTHSGNADANEYSKVGFRPETISARL